MQATVFLLLLLCSSTRTDREKNHRPALPSDPGFPSFALHHLKQLVGVNTKCEEGMEPTSRPCLMSSSLSGYSRILITGVRVSVSPSQLLVFSISILNPIPSHLLRVLRRNLALSSLSLIFLSSTSLSRILISRDTFLLRQPHTHPLCPFLNLTSNQLTSHAPFPATPEPWRRECATSNKKGHRGPRPCLPSSPPTPRRPASFTTICPPPPPIALPSSIAAITVPVLPILVSSAPRKVFRSVRPNYNHNYYCCYLNFPPLPPARLAPVALASHLLSIPSDRTSSIKPQL